MDIKLYHYHPNTKEYTGTSLARLSPLDLKQGRIYYLKPPDTTEVVPPVKPPRDWVIMYFDIQAEVWRLKNNDTALRIAQQNNILKSLVNEKNFLLVSQMWDSQKAGYWYIVYQNSTPGHYGLLHSFDRQFDDDHYDTFDEAGLEIDIIEGRAQDTNLDTPITDEEIQNSKERWSFYEEENRNAILANIEKQKSDFETTLQSDLAKESEKSETYLSQMTALLEKDKFGMEEILAQKANMKLAVLRNQIGVLINKFIANRKR